MNLYSEKQIKSRNVSSFIKPFAIIEKNLNEVRTVIDKELNSETNSEAIRRLLGFTQARSAKMLRPGILLLSGLCCDNLTSHHIKTAAIFEIIHNATLLHDDVIDQATKRRGSNTVNTLYGNESAVLLGDFLLSKVFKMSAKLDPKIAEIIAMAAEKTCRGEINQNLQRNNWQLTTQQYIQIITDKTAAIFSDACALGAQLAGSDKVTVEAFADFGLNFGIAFQLADDLIDLTSDENSAGKKGCDIENANATLPIIRLICQTSDDKKNDLIDKLRKAGDNKQVLDEIKLMLKQQGAVDYTKSKIIEYKTRAIDSISAIDYSNAKKALADTADFVIDYSA